MLELREVFDMVTNQTEPDLDSWKQQEDRQRRASRKRRIGAIVAVAAVLVAAGVLVLTTRGSNDHQSRDGSTSTTGFVTNPPIGPQVLGLDGTPLMQLPTELWGATSVRLSPDGTMLVYERDGVVHTASLDGSNDRTLTDAGNTNQSDGQNHVEWSPDGTKLAYDYSGSIFVMNADGSGKHAITTPPGGLGAYYPTWSPDGTTIAFWTGNPNGGDGGPANAEIFTVPASGGAATQLTTDASHSIEPAWSPNGKWIAFRHADAIGLVRPNGTGLHDVVDSSENPWAPAWSPDGTRIAFLRCCVQTGSPPFLDVRVVTIDTGNEQRLPIDVATDANGAQWVSDSQLLVNRYH